MSERKRVHLLRHGQSAFNVVFDINGEDPGIVDARLTDLGREQARSAAALVHGLEVDLILTSASCRALQTTLAILPGATPPPPVIVESLLRERINDPSDLGTCASDLAREFPMFDFSHLDEIWWHQGETDARGVAVEPREMFWERLLALRERLVSRPEQAFLVVGHWGVFRDVAGVNLANGQLHEWILVPISVTALLRPQVPRRLPGI